MRGNEDGRPALPFRGRISALALDPIEKKPLRRYRSGSMILSAGFVGCNLRCPFCQNWSISQRVDAATRAASPADLVEAARDAGSFGLAYTYSEPLVHAEFLLDAMEEARAAGLENVLVTNGCVLDEPAREVLALTDAANVDLKAWSARTYADVLGGDLDTVKAFIAAAAGLGVHVEVTTLVVPGLNDSDEELDGIAAFLSSLSRSLPWHLSAYRPEYRWTAPPTPAATLEKAADRARDLLDHVYLGNLLYRA